MSSKVPFEPRQAERDAFARIIVSAASVHPGHFIFHDSFRFLSRQ